MQPDLARTILIAIAAAGGVVWLVALRFLVNSFRRESSARATDRIGRFGPATGQAGGVLQGSATVEGQPGELSAKATAVLAKQGAGPLGYVKILERCDERVAFEGVRSPAGNQAVCRPGRGELRFLSSGGQTEIRYRVELAGGRWLLRLGMLFQVLGAGALVVGFWALNEFAVDHPDASVRGQVFQMFQAVHFLWPPFLLGGLYRVGRSSIRARFDTLIHNLPYREP